MLIVIILKILIYLFSIHNCLVKAFKFYENLKFQNKFVNFDPSWFSNEMWETKPRDMSIKWKREGGSRPRSFPFFSCVKLLLYTYNSSSELRSAKLKPFFLESYIAHSKLCSLSLSHTHTQTHTHTHTHAHTHNSHAEIQVC